MQVSMGRCYSAALETASVHTGVSGDAMRRGHTVCLGAARKAAVAMTSGKDQRKREVLVTRAVTTVTF